MGAHDALQAHLNQRPTPGNDSINDDMSPSTVFYYLLPPPRTLKAFVLVSPESR